MPQQRIWDLPLRLFHWSLALSVICAVVSAKIGGNAMEWHMRFGFIVMTLLLWRLAWGFMGGAWSRFSRWPLFGAPALARDSQGHMLWPGHSPRGAWASLALLLLVAVQVVSGLMADDEIATAGPWAAQVSTDMSQWATRYHHAWGQWLLLGMVGLHLSALAFYSWGLHQPLVAAMVHGRKPLPTDVAPSGDGAWLAARALLLACVCVAVVWLLVS